MEALSRSPVLRQGATRYRGLAVWRSYCDEMIGQSLSARRFVVAVLSVLLADQAYPEDQRSEAIYVGGQQKEVEKTAFDLGMWLGALYSVELSGSQDEVIAAYRRAAELANMLDIDMPMPPLGERSTERAIQGLIFTVDLSNSLSGQLFKRYGRRPVAAFFFSLTTIQARVMSADTKTQRTLLEKAITA